MPEIMDRRSLQRILQIGGYNQVDVGNDTLFSREHRMQAATDHLTLVIASGGSGAAVVREAVKMARQKLNANFNTYVKFIVVDADVRELRYTEEQCRSDNVEFLNISTPGAEQRMCAGDRSAFFRKFVHKNFPVETLGSYGSGRNRTAGKIKFYDDAVNGDTNDGKFRRLIAEFYQHDWNDKQHLQVDIMILAGLSGGTGSGTFEELAAHARCACRMAGACEVRVFGYLFLPDTLEKFAATNPEELQALYNNGYAALKELESYQSIPASYGRKEVFEARDGITQAVCEERNTLFDYPVLISGDYEESKQMMAETIVHLAAGHDGMFSQSSFYSDRDYIRSWGFDGDNLMRGGFLREDVFPEDSHYYGGIGYAYATIPEQIVKANVVSHVCQKLYQVPEALDADGNAYYFCTEEQRMSRFEMEKQVRLLFGMDGGCALDTQSFWMEKLKDALAICSRLPKNPMEITLNDIKSGNTGCYEQGFRAAERIAEGTEKLTTFLTEQMQFFKENSEKVMMAYGPRAMEFLFCGKGPNDEDGNPQIYGDIAIDEMLNEAKRQLMRIVGQSVACPEVSDLNMGIVAIVTGRSIFEWRARFREAIQHEVKQKIARKILEPGGAWERIVENPIREYVQKCSRFADSLEMLTAFYRSAGSPLDAYDYHEYDYHDFQRAAQTGNCVNLCNSDDVYGWVRETVRNKINSIDVNRVKANVIESFRRNEESWISDIEGVTRKAFDRVMAESCALGMGAENGAGMNLTVTSYFDYVLSKEPDASVVDRARKLVHDIVAGLLEKSRPALKTVPGSYQVINYFLLVPQTLQWGPYARQICDALQEEMNHLPGSGQKALDFSNAVTEIVCYQTSVANAICDLTDIGRWEHAYNCSTDDVSRHLCNGEFVSKFTERTKTEVEEAKAMQEGRAAQRLFLAQEEEIIFGTGLNWEHYPPLALRNLDENQYERQFQKEIFEPIVAYAMKEKIIERTIRWVAEDVYEYAVNLIPADWNDLDVSGYHNVDADGRLVRGEALFAYLEQRNPSSESPRKKEIVLRGRGKFAAPFDFSEARHYGKNTEQIKAQIKAQSLEYMKRILRKNTELFLELRETLCRYYEVVKALEWKEKNQEYEVVEAQERQERDQKCRRQEETEAGELEEFWRCPECGRENDHNVRFCPMCGTERPTPEEEKLWRCPHCGRGNDVSCEFCMECGVRRKRAVWRCPHCGRENDQNVRFCPMCGTENKRCHGL